MYRMVFYTNKSTKMEYMDLGIELMKIEMEQIKELLKSRKYQYFLFFCKLVFSKSF